MCGGVLLIDSHRGGGTPDRTEDAGFGDQNFTAKLCPLIEYGPDGI